MKTSFTLLALFATATFAIADEHVDQGHVAAKHTLSSLPWWGEDARPTVFAEFFQV